MSEHATIVTVSETGEGPYTNKVEAGTHVSLADEPAEIGGQDKGPAPYQLLLSALGACTSMTLRMYADRKKWDLKRVSVRLTHRKDPEGDAAKPDLITRDITLEGNLDAEQRKRLLEIANKCPVHRTLEAGPRVISGLAPAA